MKKISVSPEKVKHRKTQVTFLVSAKKESIAELDQHNQTRSQFVAKRTFLSFILAKGEFFAVNAIF